MTPDPDDDEVRPGRLGDRYCDQCDLVRDAHAYTLRAGESGFPVESIDLECDHSISPDETLTTREKRDADERGDVRVTVVDEHDDPVADDPGPG